MICFKQSNMQEKNDQVHITQKLKIGLTNCYGHRILNYFHQKSIVFGKHTFNKRVKRGRCHNLNLKSHVYICDVDKILKPIFHFRNLFIP